MFHTCGFWSFSFINAASTPLKNRILITKKEVQYLTKRILGRYGTLKSRKNLNKPRGYKKKNNAYRSFRYEPKHKYLVSIAWELKLDKLIRDLKLGRLLCITEVKLTWSVKKYVKT